MAKFNEVQKARRAEAAERKRALHGDPLTGKIRQKQPPHSVSGKRKRKLLKKWRRVLSLSHDRPAKSCPQDQKEAVDKGLITMEDVQMAAAEGTDASVDTTRTVPKFRLRKTKALKLKRGGKVIKKKKQLDSMVE